MLFPKKWIKMDQNRSCIHLPIFGFRWYFSIHSPPVFLSFGSLALLTRGLSQKKRVLLQGLLLLGHRQQQRPEEVLFGSGPTWAYHLVEALQGSIHGWTRTLMMIFDDLLMMFLDMLIWSHLGLIWSDMIGSHLIISDLYCPVPAATLQFSSWFQKHT